MQNQITVTIANATPTLMAAIAGAFKAHAQLMGSDLDTNLGQPQDLSTALQQKIDAYIVARDDLESMIDLAEAALHCCDGDSYDGDEGDFIAGDEVSGTPCVSKNLIRTADDYLGLEVGDSVHWKGAKFEFDGVVDEIDLDAEDFMDGDTPDVHEDHKVLILCRNDTGKRVSLTWPDLQTGELTFN
jgi:hypothetical protein